MKFGPRKRLGIFLMAICLVSIVVITYTLFLHTDDGKLSEGTLVEDEGSEELPWVPEAIWSSDYPDGFESGGHGLNVPHSGSK